MDLASGEEKKKRRGRPKLGYKDLATRITTSNAGENYQEVCIKNVFERIKFQSHGLKKRPEIPDADISVSVPSVIAQNLKRMGITQLLPTQRYTLPLLTDHDTDLFVGAATGHGKTLAFLIPIAVSLMRARPRLCSSSGRPLALVIANTQVLQVQTYNVATSLLLETGIRTVLVCGETPKYESMKAIEKGVDIIIATTGRLLEFINSGNVKLDGLRYFIYDEADKMTQFGAFRNDVAEITEHIPAEIRPQLRSCFFTATLEGISSFENMYRMEQYCMVVVPGNPLITHHLLPLDETQDNDRTKSLILMQLLLRDVQSQGRTVFDKSTLPYMHKTVVFVGLKTRCNYLAAYLRMYGYSVGVANSDLSLDMRNKIIQRFCNGEIQALIATDSMARGHDIPNVTHVINYDMSDNALDTFKHRAGRTARIGHKGTCTTLISRAQFHLFDDSLVCELSQNRKRAAELARYLVMECGQRIPKCLVKSTYIAIGEELAEMKWNVTPEEALEELGAYEMEDDDSAPSLPQTTSISIKTEGAATESKTNKALPPTVDIPSSSQLHNPVSGVPSPKNGMMEWVTTEPPAMPVHQKPPAKLALEMDDDGFPIFDASETERETTDCEDDEDTGGVTIDESDFDDDSYFKGEDYHPDSDSDGPREAIFAESPVPAAANGGDSDDANVSKPMVWTSDEDENEVDKETEAERMAALQRDYERQQLEKKMDSDEVEEEEENSEDEDDDDVD